MHWHDTSLSGLLRNQEEVKLGTSIFVLDETRIKNGARLRIFKLLFLDEHPLVDSLVHDDKSELG